tara:strand:+ start:18822 stop:19100 length:279 start_codon:yes stop_codon:yes gene_type:complete
MIELKFGDEVWFFGTDMGRRAWGDDYTVIYPQWTDLISGVVVDVNDDKDSTCIYVRGEDVLLNLAYDCLGASVFKSKVDAINNMIKRMEMLR